MPTLDSTPIPGLLVVHLDVHGDDRGWFKENWQRAKMIDLGLPDFGPVQNNVSYNSATGVTRGIHAEPWDKFVSVTTGRVFGAWVDLRAGASFGFVYTHEIGPDTAVYVPRGVGNAYQVLEDDTAYTYLVNAHWRPEVTYTELHLGDPAVAIPWPIPLSDPRIQTSAKDASNPMLADVTPVAADPVLVIGAGGQVGRALLREFPEAVGITRDELDIADPVSVARFDFSPYRAVINAAAYTAVDAAESPEGRSAAWAANASGPTSLAEAASRHGLILVHYSSDYVYDGEAALHHEDEPMAPLGVYAQSKAAGDLAVSVTPRHYILRTSWVIGDGHNFVATMRRLARDGVSPAVVSDQVGRLTFTADLAAATRHLLETEAAYGIYHVSGSGQPGSWADIARAVFKATGRSARDVSDQSTADYAQGRQVAPRPANSVLSLTRLEATGFTMPDQWASLAGYLDES